MTTSHLVCDLELDEGCRLTAYPDPLSGGEPWTIGYGHAGREVRPGLVWTLEQARTALATDAAKACSELDLRLPWWRELSDLRQDVIANMAFNLGVTKLLEFTSTLALMRGGRWDAAADAMLASAWAHQVGGRARRLAEQMRTGIHP